MTCVSHPHAPVHLSDQDEWCVIGVVKWGLAVGASETTARQTHRDNVHVRCAGPVHLFSHSAFLMNAHIKGPVLLL